ncbi:alpha/beta fold hydrolase [Bdellovibrio sp. BCCA]|uniref:alpha/beta fold hydrolase n=1 Tax=Bdellovibrio sp. BCCA TaxID=3136281 RepID=UPI0030F252EB
MATLKVNGTEYYYEEHGPKEAPAIVLSPLLYTDTSVYEPLIRMFSDDYRVIVYDHRGLGKSAGAPSASLENSAKDVAALIEKLNLGPCHFVGNCLGSFVGLHLAIHRSDLLKSCTLMGATAESESDETVRDMDTFITNAKKNGMKSSAKSFSEMWFGSTFRNTKDPIQVTRREKWINHLGKLKPESLDAATQIYHRSDVTKDLSKISCAVLVIAGDEDSPTNLEAYRRMVKAIPNAEFKTIHHAGYALVIEQPEEIAENILTFIERVEHHWAAKQKQSPREFGFRKAS